MTSVFFLFKARGAENVPFIEAQSLFIAATNRNVKRLFLIALE